MKILIYGLNFWPELTGIGKYSGEMAEWLANQGHDVRVIAAPPYYPQWKVLDGYSALSYRTETHKGCTIIRCPVWVPKISGGIKRILHLMTFAISSLPVLLAQVRWRPDIVFVLEPTLFCAPGALLLSRLSGAKSWLHIQDFEVDAAFALNLLKGQKSQSMALACERSVLKRFDKISSISSTMVKLAERKIGGAKRAFLFPNWVDAEGISPNYDGARYRQELGIPQNALVVMYSGNMGGKQGIEILAEVAKSLSGQTDIYFVFCGSGAARSALELASQHLSNVRILDLQPLERLGEFLCLADLHLLPQKPGAEGLVMPSKLINIFASGRPVIAGTTTGSELAILIEGRGCVVEPGNLVEYVEAIGKLRDEGLRRSLGSCAREYVVNSLQRDQVLSAFTSEAQSLRSGV